MFAIALGGAEIILIIGIISCVVAYRVGSKFAKSLRDDQAKIFGAVAILIGVLLAIYGISSLNSVSSQMMALAGRADVGGIAAIVIGAWVGAGGLGVLVKGGGQKIHFLLQVPQVQARRKSAVFALKLSKVTQNFVDTVEETSKSRIKS